MRERIFCLALYVLASVSMCNIAHSEPAVDLLRTKLDGMRTLKANFRQTVHAKQQATSSSSGNMALQRPGRFRWHIKEPMQQIIVADGKNFWIYDVELEQVTVQLQKKGLGGAAALFLSGFDDEVAKLYRVSQSGQGDSLVFTLKSKNKQSGFQKVLLYFVGDKLTRIDLLDNLGQRTEVKLNHQQANVKLSERLFKFKPPRGVDVIRQ